jgi:hypothetical protein
MLLRLLRSLVVCWSMLLTTPVWAAAMTNSDVISMMRSGLSADTVRLSVDSAADAQFDTSPDALIGLSKAGVPQAVIQAMLRRASATGPQAPVGSAARSVATPQTKRVSVLPRAIIPVVGQSYVTRYNFWHERGRHLTTNYMRGEFVPINTRVKLVSLAQREMVLELPSGQTVIFEWVKDYTLRPLAEIASELLGERPVPIEQLGGELATSVKSGELRLGMTKEQVLLTRGYPPRHRTPTLAENRWVYWSNRFVTLTLLFDDDILIEGRGIR